jgi:hypothetical protein
MQIRLTQDARNFSTATRHGKLRNAAFESEQLKKGLFSARYQYAEHPLKQRLTG